MKNVYAFKQSAVYPFVNTDIRKNFYCIRNNDYCDISSYIQVNIITKSRLPNVTTHTL